MTRTKRAQALKLVALALMACALAVSCQNAPGTMMKEEPPATDTPDPNAGIAWRLVRAGTGGELLLGVAWGGGRFVAVGETGTIAHSADGVTWTEAGVTRHGRDASWSHLWRWPLCRGRTQGRDRAQR